MSRMLAVRLFLQGSRLCVTVDHLVLGDVARLSPFLPHKFSRHLRAVDYACLEASDTAGAKPILTTWPTSQQLRCSHWDAP